MLGLKLNYVSIMGYREMKANINLMHGRVIWLLTINMCLMLLVIFIRFSLILILLIKTLPYTFIWLVISRLKCMYVRFRVNRKTTVHLVCWYWDNCIYMSIICRGWKDQSASGCALICCVSFDVSVLIRKRCKPIMEAMECQVPSTYTSIWIFLLT